MGRRRISLLDRPGADPANEVQERPRLVVGARRPGATERLETDDRAGGLVIDVEVSGRVDERLGCLADRVAILLEDGAPDPLRPRFLAPLPPLLHLSLR